MPLLFRPGHRPYPSAHVAHRAASSWASKLPWRATESATLGNATLPDGHEEAAKAAILDKVMQGRQPTDLLLRCACPVPRARVPE
jgi:hypothetical protein